MSTPYPVTSFGTRAESVQGLIDLLQSEFQNPEALRGTVKFVVPECPDYSFIASYSDSLEIDRDDIGRDTDTRITIPIDTIERIFKEFEYLDWRDPEIIGTISFEGNLYFANHLAKSCLRPSQPTIRRFRQVGEQHRRLGYKDLKEIKYLQSPTQLQILEAMEESRPVVIKGLEPIPPCRDWTIDKLAYRFGESIVRVRSATQRQNMREFVQELKEFEANSHAEIIEGFVKPYTEGAVMPEEMWADFGPLFFDREDFMPPQLWLGAVPTHIPTSSLHRDTHTGFLLQVIGRKRLDLYSADQESLIYPYKAYNNYQPCWFKPEAPNFDIYPNAKQASCLSVTLHPGELLLQPAGWFHQVYAIDSPNMSTSYFWRY